MSSRREKKILAAAVKTEGLCAGYGEKTVLKDVSLTVSSGERWVLIGKNGTGKSTFVKAAASLVTPSSGRVCIHGKDISRTAPKERAKMISYVPQSLRGVIPYTVSDYMLLGRYAFSGPFGTGSSSDKEAVKNAAALCDVEDLLERYFSTLSGGELQRVLLAGAVAQEAPLMLLDEPATFLDPAHEHLFYRALERVQNDRGLTFIMVTHDVNTAIYKCTHICALCDGRVFFQGESGDFRKECPGILESVYGISFKEYFSEDKSAEIYGTWKGCS